MPTFKKVRANRDNNFTISLVDDNGSFYPFLSSGVSEMRLHIGGKILSSLTSDITYNDVGKITFTLGNDVDVLSLPRDINYKCKLLVFDPAHLKGQCLIAPDLTGSQLTVQIKD